MSRLRLNPKVWKCVVAYDGEDFCWYVHLGNESTQMYETVCVATDQVNDEFWTKVEQAILRMQNRTLSYMLTLEVNGMKISSKGSQERVQAFCRELAAAGDLFAQVEECVRYVASQGPGEAKVEETDGG